MSRTSEPIFIATVDMSRGVIVMMCYEDGCEFDVDMDFYRAHMDKSGKWTVTYKKKLGG